MRNLIAILLFLACAPAQANELIHSGPEEVKLMYVGLPPVRGYWTVDKKGRPVKNVAGWNQDLKLRKIGASYNLIKRERKAFSLGDTPMTPVSSRMTEKTCKSVDLAPKMGPVKSQTGGSCYAYTAMELLNFGTEERYSALFLAQMKEGKVSDSNLAKVDKDPLRQVRGFTGGQIRDSIEQGMTLGLCPDSKVPDQHKPLKQDYVKLLAYYRDLKKREKAIQDLCHHEAMGLEFKDQIGVYMKYGFEIDDLWKTEEVKEAILKAYPGADPTKIREIWGTSKDATEFMKKLALLACEDHLKDGIPPGKTPENIKSKNIFHSEDGKNFYYEDERAGLLQHINDALDGGRPIGISYFTGGLIQAPKTEDHAKHASAVAGRKWLPEEKDSEGKVTRPAGCYYLVKNSWGEDWKVKDGLKASSSALHPGYFVVSEKQLMEHTYGTVSID